jgi:hypothetical protein
MDIWRPVMKNAVEGAGVATDHVETPLGRVLPALVRGQALDEQVDRTLLPAGTRACDAAGLGFQLSLSHSYSPQTRNIGGQWL